MKIQFVYHSLPRCKDTLLFHCHFTFIHFSFSLVDNSNVSLMNYKVRGGKFLLKYIFNRFVYTIFSPNFPEKKINHHDYALLKYSYKTFRTFPFPNFPRNDIVFYFFLNSTFTVWNDLYVWECLFFCRFVSLFNER